MAFTEFSIRELKKGLPKGLGSMRIVVWYFHNSERIGLRRSDILQASPELKEVSGGHGCFHPFQQSDHAGSMGGHRLNGIILQVFGSF